MESRGVVVMAMDMCWGVDVGITLCLGGRSKLGYRGKRFNGVKEGDD